LQDHAEKIDRIFTSRERAACENAGTSISHRMRQYAAAFAAKEAVMKALATGWKSGIEWADIETPVSPSTRARLRGEIACIAVRKNVAQIIVSTAITRESVLATAVAESAADTALGCASARKDF
jgi:holo-[acyl-carrier protein] synthase